MKSKNKIDLFILNFCKEISTKSPVLVPLRPLPNKPINECFTIVPEHIVAHGGKQKIGWCIHVWRKVLIEAEFHCIWESPEGKLIDITPKNYQTDLIIFLPDSTKSYTDRQVDNIRKSISADKNVSDLIKLHQEYFKYSNKGDLANHFGKIKITEDFIDQYKLMGKIQNQLTSKYGNNRGIYVGGRFIKYIMASYSY